MGKCAARFVPIGKVAQFDGQPASLNGIQSTVVTFEIVVILLRLAVIADHLHAQSHGFIVCGNGSGLTASPEILSWVEAESSSLSDGACFSPSIGSL